MWNSIDRFLDKYGNLVLVLGVVVSGLTLFPLVFGEKTRSGAAARECLPGDSETWIPAEGLTCISARPPMLTGSYEEDFVSYQVPQERITEHIDRWQNFARGAERGQDCAQGIKNSSPRAWPRVEELEVVTALPPNMDQGCVWVMRDTGWFYIQIRWGH
jgi:hypothetical protein